MEIQKLLNELGYSGSPHFLRRDSAGLATAPDFGHIFRHAVRAPCHLEGVYALRRCANSKIEPLVPSSTSVGRPQKLQPARYIGWFGTRTSCRSSLFTRRAE